MAEKKFKGISVITAGPALGHDMVIDETTLEQVVELGNANSPVKVLANHSNDVGAILGMLENFRIDGPRVRADLELLENHPQAEYYAELLGKLPDQLGFSISFSGIPRMAEDGTVLADVRDLWSVDLVTRAAANKSIYSAKPVDTAKVAMVKEPSVVETKIEAAAEAAPAAPAAPVAVFNAEEAIAALAAKIETLSQQFADLVTAKLEAAVVEDAPADEAPVAEPAPEPVAVAAEAKAEAKELSQPVPSVIAAKVIELEASRGTQPLEVSTETTFSRADLLSQFNAEKDPRRAAEIFKKLQLAR
jgi:hypothetical protein